VKLSELGHFIKGTSAAGTAHQTGTGTKGASTREPKNDWRKVAENILGRELPPTATLKPGYLERQFKLKELGKLVRLGFTSYNTISVNPPDKECLPRRRC
jgi:hypothetical protein